MSDLQVNEKYRVSAPLSAERTNNSPNQQSRSWIVWMAAAQVWTIFGLALSSLCLGLGIIGSAVVLWRERSTARLVEVWKSCQELLVPVVVYLIAFGISAATSVQPAKSFGDFFSTVFSMSALLLILMWIRGEERTRWMLKGVVFAIAGFALYGIGQVIFTDYGPVWNRTPGPFSHYMTFSGVLLIGVLILLAKLVNRAGRHNLTNWALLALMVLAMALTLTRHVWIATLVAVTIMVWSLARRWTPVYVAALVIAGLTLSACAPEQWGRVRSILDFDNASNYDRLCMTWTGAQMISDRPFFGVGPGSVEETYSIYRHPTAPRAEAKHLHNTFVHMAAERGLIELAAYLWLMFVAARAGWRGYRQEALGGTRADLYFTTFLAVLVINLAGLFEANWRDTEVSRLMLFVIAIPWLLRPTDQSAPRSGLEAAAPETTQSRSTLAEAT